MQLLSHARAICMGDAVCACLPLYSTHHDVMAYVRNYLRKLLPKPRYGLSLYHYLHLETVHFKDCIFSEIRLIPDA